MYNVHNVDTKKYEIKMYVDKSYNRQRHTNFQVCGNMKWMRNAGVCSALYELERMLEISKVFVYTYKT